MIDPELIAEGRKLLDLAVMPEQPVTVYDDNADGSHPLSQWRISNDPDLLNDEWSEEPVLSLIVDIGDPDEAKWIAWLINNGAALLDELEGAHVALGRLKQSVEQDYTAIAAKHDRDRARKARALAIVKQHASADLLARVTAALDGTDE
jgi:hypothetical protein